MRDPSINAFALPGGFIGVHTGLITASDSESEIASVLAHEIAHVTQRHIARMIGIQKQMQIPMMIAIAAAMLLGRSRPDLASRRERPRRRPAPSSRSSRFTPRFRARGRPPRLPGAERRRASTCAPWRRSSRKCSARRALMDSGAVPSYLRTHPVTDRAHRRRAGRAAGHAVSGQHLDSLEFHLVRAKLRAEAMRSASTR